MTLQEEIRRCAGCKIFCAGSNCPDFLKIKAEIEANGTIERVEAGWEKYVASLPENIENDIFEIFNSSEYVLGKIL